MKKMLYLLCAGTIVLSCRKSSLEISTPAPTQPSVSRSDTLIFKDTVLHAPSSTRMMAKRFYQTHDTIAVLYINFEGEEVSGTFWNRSDAPIHCNKASLTFLQKISIVQKVAEHYSPYNVLVTTNRREFDRAPEGKKAEVIVTDYNPEIFPIKAGGVSFLLSMVFVGVKSQPGFVFSDLLGNNAKYVSDATAHELGHMTAGLPHDAVWDGCQVLNQYRPSVGFGPESWGSLMGYSYDASVSTFTDAAHAFCYNALQQENQELGFYLGFRKDNVGNDFEHAKTLSLQLHINGAVEVLENSNDIDMFFVTKGRSHQYRISLTSGGSTDFKIVVYDKHGNQVSVLQKDGSLSVPYTLLQIPKLNEGFYLAVMRRNDDPQSFIPKESSTGGYTLVVADL